MTDFLLKARGITKDFPGVRALDDVSFDLYAGEVHILFRENGAGKSTLIKILSGSYQPDHGQILLRGRKAVFRNPFDARRLGLAAVYQEFSLVPQLTVLENLFLGSALSRWGFLSNAAMAAKAEKSLQDRGIGSGQPRFWASLFARFSACSSS